MSERSRRERGQSLTELALVLPILLVLLLAISDLARAFATMIIVESAAREAADWGAFNPGNWDIIAPQYPLTVAEMERRSCTPATSLPDYQGAADGSTCTNPSFECALILDNGTTTSCSLPSICATLLGSGTSPCKVRVTLTYRFSAVVAQVIPPWSLSSSPTTFTFQRQSIFNVADTPSG